MFCRMMKVSDIDMVHKVEVDSFSDPWTKNAFKREMKNNMARYIVCVDSVDGNEVVIGYIGSWYIIDEAHINNVAISPDYRGKGYGRQMMEYFIDMCRKDMINAITLEVRRSNEVAQNLYKSMGFVPAGVRKEYYSDNREDAIIMWKQMEVK